MSDFELRWEEPIFLLALLVIPLLVLFDWLYLRKVHTAVRRTGMILRCAALLTAVCMLAGLTLYTAHTPVDLVILSDVSDSMDPDAVAEAVQTLTQRAEQSGDYASVREVRFASRALTEETETPPAVFSATNLRGALEEGVRFHGEGRRLHLLLLTDGLETEGNLRREAARQADVSGLRLDAVYLPASREKPEAQVSSVETPSLISLGEQCEIFVRCASRTKQSASLRLMNGNVVVQQKKLTLNPGETTVSFRVQPEAEGPQVYRLVLAPAQDTVQANNVWDLCLQVQRERSVLILCGGQADPGPLEKELREMENEVRVLSEKKAPLTAAEIGNYSLVILMDVDAQNMPPASLRNISDYVNVYGGSVLALGGAHTFGYGHMEDTLLEKMLPVSMQVTDKDSDKATALLLMIDNSASMAEARSHLANATDNSINMAKLGAIACVQALADQDWIGVISFSDSAKVVSPMVQASRREEVINAITSMGTLNGTNYTGALETALEAMDGITGVSEKHIMFISDGSPGDEGYMDVVRRIREHGIVLSTIGIGSDIYQDVLTGMAAAGGGNYSSVSVGDDLVKRMLWDASLYRTAYTVTGTQLPVDTLGSFPPAPALEGYIRVTPRAQGQVLLATQDDDPLYVVWQYGTGQAAAFMSDLEGKWSSAWFSSADGRNTIRKMLSGLMPEKALYAASSVQLAQQGSSCLLSVRLDDLPEHASVQTQIQSPAGRRTEVSLEHAGGGYWQTEFPSDGDGVYQITLLVHDADSGNTVEIHRPAATSWVKEYNAFAREEEALELLRGVCAQMGGEVLDAQTALEENRMEHVRASVSLRPALAVLTVMLLCVEILLRRRSIRKNRSIS